MKIENNQNNQFGKRLANIRKEKGLSQKELAQKINVSWRILSDYERGKARLNDKIIYKIAIALNISADEILGIKGIHNKSTSLKIMRRVKKLKELSPLTQKKILSILDDLILAAEKKE